VLEPSAGTGCSPSPRSAAHALLNELADTRADLLASLFPAVTIIRFDAAQIDDHLDPAAVPSVVLMNPPFSVLANVSGALPTPPIAISPRHWPVSPTAGGWSRSPAPTSRRTFRPGAMPSCACRTRRVVFTAAIAGSVYAKHGTTIETRLTVIDKAPAADPEHFPDPPASHPTSRRCSAGSKRSFRPPAGPDRAFRRDAGHHAAHGARISRARGSGPARPSHRPAPRRAACL
jgi:hypothetical protein